ncbi:MAG TPA: dioxygenase [Acidimicrobiales bacterium]|nr:dioxygenase [Acidimicrobiales bacterium]
MTTNITPAEHLAAVQATFSGAGDPRLADVMRSLVAHLHAFVVDVGLTRDEWFAGIDFLTRVGHMCDGQRQEFILLSDTLGVSMLVEMLAQGGVPGTTEPTVFGPFHVEGAPERALGASIVEPGGDLPGEPLTVAGTVRSLDGTPLGGARLDVWQTAPNGLYDVQDERQPAMNLRGVFTAAADGGYHFRTLRPVAYPIPGDGPVGEMLRATGRHNWRPAHIHFVVSAPGHKPVITHVFDRASAYLDSDAVFGVRDSLVVGMDGGTARFDPVLEPVA